MSGKVVVSDSSTIIALARVCYLNILEKLFGSIKVPEAVWEEVAITGSRVPGK